MDRPILYGGLLSPYTRRVAIWLNLHEIAFDLQPMKLFEGDFEQMRAHNPLSRIPALELPGTPTLIEAWAIIDTLEDRAPADRKLIPESGDARRVCMQLMALGSGIADKTVALTYETVRRPPEFQWDGWAERMTAQTANGLAALDAQTPEGEWFGGEAPNGADVVAVCAYDYVAARAAHLAPKAPRLGRLAAEANKLPAFAKTRPA